MNTVTNEPVAIAGALSTVAVVAIPFLRTVGVHVTQDQADTGLALLAALIALGTVVVRSRVTPTSKALDAVSTALDVDPTHPVQPKPETILAGAKA